ncbi:chlorophyll antenna size regulatory protein [Coccomyxa subellipsoidea C-169]|uniref:Chlorophyll antenna size regulatory protein n=1 Tax=Coccomyxa subellipsoidea (strain C-169) TaxID=574566 RepID=I0Z740_COCSC|nr:chlorophyll antenna size regulatory protein [Coccomyxa subellipsoidea C-169]EIE26459.1 chlorophyll antenna size regulatory protein [Coccomyxa subellipsoidea C-169]|eukprot:XP_005651003.1 chlorophyll antenna size regulatory protein [Coccomyxa subellipsoidea C-169]
MGCSIDRLAILKILLHAAKYPSASINGVLLGRESPSASDGEAALLVVDAIPLFHSFLTLAPSLETALLQVDAFCRADGKVKVVGYYHANERLNELDLKPAARKIADRIQQRIPQAVTLLLDNGKLSGLAEHNSTDILQLWVKDGRGWVRSAANRLKADSGGLADLYMEMLLQGKHSQISDFDDHLNDLTKDWTNKDLL